MPTVRATLTLGAGRLARASDTPELDARILLQHRLGADEAWLISHAEDALNREQSQLYAQDIERRQAGEPVAYITGRKEFWSMPLAVDRSVLVPRPETEHLVEHALACLPPDEDWQVADLGTGCGAIALAIARERPRCRVIATDISSAALATAKDNARRLGVRNVEFRLGDWFAALGDERFEMVVSNPPYVAEGDRHLRELVFEPALALRAGRDGLDAISAIAAGAGRHLRGPGWLALEHGYDQRGRVDGLLRRLGFRQITCYRDYAGRPRVTVCRAAAQA